MRLQGSKAHFYLKPKEIHIPSNLTALKGLKSRFVTSVIPGEYDLKLQDRVKAGFAPAKRLGLDAVLKLVKR
ncbi:hypothetical protein [Nitrosovibrio sp. Nv6]|uniref:hypothetical protein n=1 Tax=Nitrosovibrio sp. Nv6 TaxID=1855340 RepID=UPI0008B19A86|nr:hypothetical protein [Nitrosovibrio sp. Nv6]SEP43679.1 hypothetical protein SAMN05216316_3135 [Nitrosovibrio sp. Nv6]